MITSPWALESGVGQMLKEQLHKSHIFKPMVLQKKILTKKKVKDVFNSAKHLLKKWIHYVFLGKDRIQYMLIKLIHLEVLSLNLYTDLCGRLKSQEATSCAKTSTLMVESWDESKGRAKPEYR